MFFLEESIPVFSFIPNISYNYQVPNNDKVALFGGLGYGLSNSNNLFGLLVRKSNSFDVGIINTGAGIKYLISEKVA